MPKKIILHKFSGDVHLFFESFTKQYVGIAKSKVDAQAPPIILMTLSIFGKIIEIIQVAAIKNVVMKKFSLFVNSSFLSTMRVNCYLTGFHAIGNATRIEPITPHMANRTATSFSPEPPFLSSTIVLV